MLHPQRSTATAIFADGVMPAWGTLVGGTSKAEHDGTSVRLRGGKPSIDGSAVQADLYRIALANVPQGLCMFDAEMRLILCNEAYAAMYRLPAHPPPGTHRDEILARRKALGTGPVDLGSYFDVVSLARQSGRHGGARVKLEDGRTVQISHSLMDDGGYVTVHEDVTERVVVEDQLRYLAAYDHLTDLYNRRAFRELLACALAQPEGEIAVLCLDLDRFKAVNDALGHHYGDMLLQQVARRLAACASSGDVVGRLGGDEFIVMQRPGEERQKVVCGLARRLVDTLTRPYRLDRHLVSIGTSVGIAIHPTHGATTDDLLKNADRALYMAKAEGGNGFRVFGTDVPAEA